MKNAVSYAQDSTVTIAQSFHFDHTISGDHSIIYEQ